MGARQHRPPSAGIPATSRSSASPAAAPRSAHCWPCRPRAGCSTSAIAQSCSGSLRLASPRRTRRGSPTAWPPRSGISRATGEALQAVPMPTRWSRLSPRGSHRCSARCMTARSSGPTRSTRPPPPPPAAVPVMFGNAATEARLYMAADMANFTLDAAEVQRRLARFLQHRRRDRQPASMTVYRGALPNAVAQRRHGRRRDRLHVSAQHHAGGGAVRGQGRHRLRLRVRLAARRCATACCARRTPIEVPFVFGTAPAAAALVGDGPDVATLTATMVATWSAFARTGKPGQRGDPGLAALRGRAGAAP